MYPATMAWETTASALLGIGSWRPKTRLPLVRGGSGSSRLQERVIACMCPLTLWHGRMETVGSSPSSDREALAGLVERVTFHNTDNGFCVPSGQSSRASRPGHGTRRGAIYFDGRIHSSQWKVGDPPRPRATVSRTFLRATPPTSTEGMENYLGSGLIKGTGPIFTPGSSADAFLLW